MINILITGIGAPLGQSIAKAAKLSNLPLNIYVSDNGNQAAGFYSLNLQNILTPAVADVNYLEFMLNIVEKFELKFIFPTIRVEFEFFGKHRQIFESLGCKIVMNLLSDQLIADNKYDSIQALRSHGISTPVTLSLDNFFDEENDLEFPAVIKPKTGASSKDVFFVDTFEDAKLQVLRDKANQFVIQEYLPGEEFTVGVLLEESKGYAISMKRVLKFGLSYTGEVVKDEKLEDYCLKVAKYFNLFNGANIQLKFKDGIPVLFEINPRLSSTSSIRAHFGFNEIEFIISRYMNSSKYKPEVRVGKFSRYWEELYY